MGRVARLSFATTLCFAANCAPVTDADLAEGSQAIIQGDPAGEDQWQSVGMLMTKGNVSRGGAPAKPAIMGLCTATLISPTAVLTAEHCVNEELLKQQLAAQPDIQLEGDVSFEFTFARKISDVQGGSAEVLQIASIDHSPSFGPIEDPVGALLTPAPAKWNDIAIVHLTKSVTGRRLQPLATPEMVEALKIDGELNHLATGYGLTDDDDQMSAGNLTFGFSSLDEIGEFEITAGDGNRQQACRGDSGGPMFAGKTDAYQIGVASRVNLPPLSGIGGNGQPPPCETGLAYTRVDAYLDWISEHVSDLPTPGTGGDGSVGDGDGDGDGEVGDGSSDDGSSGDGDGDGTDEEDGSSDDGASGDGDGDGDGTTPPRKGDDGCSVSSTPSTGLAQLVGFAGLFTLATLRRRRRNA